MMNSHMALGIAQIIFYIPIVPLAVFLNRRNWAYHPRMAWWPFILFSLMRLAGGPVVIAFYKKPSVGLAIAAIVLLNVGAVPLIVAASGFLRIVLVDNYRPTARTKRLTGILRATTICAIGLLTAGGAVGGQDDPDLRKIGRILSLVGYGVFGGVLVGILTAAVILYTKRSRLIPSSTKVLHGLLFSGPFLIIRCIYGVLQVANEFDSKSPWNILYGSAVAFALMALLVEYIVVITFFAIGFSMPPNRGAVPFDNEAEPNSITKA